MKKELKVLVFCYTGLGNIVLFLPAYQAFRKKYPNAEITIALDSRWYGDSFFMRQFGNDVHFVLFPSKAEGLRAISQKVWCLRRQRFDLVFMPYSGPSKKLGLILLMLGAKQTLFFKTGMWLLDSRFDPCLPVIDKEHYLERNMRQVKALGIDGEIPDGWIVKSDEHVNKFRYKKNEEIWLGIHPGVNAEFNEARQWPTTHLAKLLNIALARPKTKVVLFGRGPNEQAIIHSLIKGRDHHCLLVIDCPLDKVSAYLLLCDVFIGNDSGIMNLAVGLGVPTVAILGPTDPRHTRPYGRKHRVARLELECSPCFDRGYSLNCKHRKCLTELSPDYVYSLINEVLLEKTRN